VGPEEMLELVLKSEDEGLSTEEICRRYGVKKHTYYRWRRRLVRAGLRLLQQSLRLGSEQVEVSRDVASLQEQLVEAQRAKMIWELRYKWLVWQLSSIDDPKLQALLAKVERNQVPLP